jgi:Domain of unknown function (DUF4157)
MSRRELDLFPAAKAGPAPAHRAEAPASVGTPARSRAAMLPGGNSGPLAAVLARTGGGRLKGGGSALLQLQRDYGNRYVQRMVDQARIAPVSQADDRCEREADRVAQAVVGGATPTVNRATNHPPAIQRLSGAEGGPVDAGVQQAIQGARGSGQPLPKRVRGPLERAFGADFARVRLHTDVQADQLSRALRAQAFTTGRDIFFRRGEYDADSIRGQHTLAHELTHVVQQRDRPMVVQCLRRRRAALTVNANLRQGGELIQRVPTGAGITIDLDSVQTSPDGKRSYKLMKVTGKDVSDQGWWLRRKWFHLLHRKRRTEKEKASSPSSAGFFLSRELFQGEDEQANQQPRSKYVHNLVVQFGSPESSLDHKIRGGSEALISKLNKLAPYKLTEKQEENLPAFGETKVISVERKSQDDSFDRQAVKDVRNALRTLRAASESGLTRLYLRGHGDPKTKTLGGWSAQAVWSFLSKCGIKGMKIDVISVTGCQLALRPDEMMNKMGSEWREANNKNILTGKEAQLYNSRYYRRGEKVYQQPGPAGHEKEESFPAILTGIMSGSLANNPAVLGRTEYVDVASQGTKATSYAAHGSLSGLKSKGTYSKREYRWDPELGKVVWNWVN